MWQKKTTSKHDICCSLVIQNDMVSRILRVKWMLFIQIWGTFYGGLIGNNIVRWRLKISQLYIWGLLWSFSWGIFVILFPGGYWVSELQEGEVVGSSNLGQEPWGYLQNIEHNEDICTLYHFVAEWVVNHVATETPKKLESQSGWVHEKVRQWTELKLGLKSLNTYIIRKAITTSEWARKLLKSFAEESFGPTWTNTFSDQDVVWDTLPPRKMKVRGSCTIPPT